MRTKNKILIGAVTLGLFLAGFLISKAATPEGDIKVIHSNGVATYYNATTSSNTGRGTALSSALGNCTSGDIFYLAPETFDMQARQISLACGTGSVSLIGSGKYQTIIKGSNSTSVIQPAANSQTANLSILYSGTDGTAWGTLTNINLASTTLTNAYILSSSTAIFLGSITPGENPYGSVTVSNVDGVSIYSGAVFDGVGISDLNMNADFYNSNFTAKFLSSTGNYLLNASVASLINLYNTNFTLIGGTNNIAVRTALATVNYYSGVVTTPAGNTDLDAHIAGGDINVNSNVKYSPTKSTFQSYLDNPQILYSAGSSGTNGKILQTDGTKGNWVATSTLGLSPWSYLNLTDIYNTNFGKVGIGTTTPWGLLSINATSSLGTNPKFVIGSSTATSLIVTNAGNLGVNTLTPTNPFQVFDAVSAPLPATGGSRSIDYNGGGYYPAGGYTHAYRIYTYRDTSAYGRIYSSKYLQITPITDNGSLNQYDVDISWTAPTGSYDGFVVLVSDDYNGYNYDAAKITNAVLLVDSGDWPDDTTILPNYGAGVVVNNNAGIVRVGIGTSTPQYPLVIDQLGPTRLLNMVSNSSYAGNNGEADIVVVDRSDQIARVRIGESGSGSSGYGNFSMEATTTQINGGIIGEFDFINHAGTLGDQRLALIQTVTSADKNTGRIAFLTLTGVNSFSANIVADGDGTTLIGNQNNYNKSAGSRLAVAGNLSVGSTYARSNIAPTDGAIIQGFTGIGTTSPWGLFSINPNALGSASTTFVIGSSTATSFIVDKGGRIAGGTTTPYAALSIQSNASTGDAFTVATSSQKAVFGVDNDGHKWTSGPVPAISSCGTGSPAITGDDQGGTITTGTVASSCTITFAKAYQQIPYCNISTDSTASIADISSISTSAATFGLSVSLSGGHLYYSCSYHK